MANNIDELLPDFEDMDAVASASAAARLRASELKEQLNAFISKCVREALQNPQLWVNGKPPTQVYIDRVVTVVGNTDEDAAEIRKLTHELLEQQKEADETRQLLLNMRDRIAAYQTISSNKRAGVL